MMSNPPSLTFFDPYTDLGSLEKRSVWIKWVRMPFIDGQLFYFAMAIKGGI